MRKTKFRITFDDGETKTITLQAKPLEKNDGVYFIIVVSGGAADGYNAALTRKREIESMENFDSKTNRIYFLEIDDLSLLKDEIEKCIDNAKKNNYGPTIEVSFFGHAGNDGPVGNHPMKNKEMELSTLSGYHTEHGQLTPEAWSKINWNFDKNNSIACFYGCLTSGFTEKFVDFKTGVRYAAGLGGKAGGSKTYKGGFNASWFGFGNVYMVDEENDKVLARWVFERGEDSGEGQWESYGIIHKIKNGKRIFGNVTVKNGKLINGSK